MRPLIPEDFMSPERLRDVIVKFLDDRKALNIVCIDLAGKSSIADFMVIASGTSQRHVSSTVTLLREELKKHGIKGISVEGEQAGDWVLLDAGDVVVHVFRPEVRDFYALEKMWGATLPDDDHGEPQRASR